jgi:nucleotide-binding universal stress UspA family protein
VGLHGPVLAATDLSETADAAIRQGHAIAGDLGAPFIACHVLPEALRVRVLFPQDAGIDAPVQAEIEHKATTAVRARVDAVLGAASPSVRVEIETGSAHAGILAVADRVGAGLVVVGPGATAHRVARAVDGPVLVARSSPTGGGVLAATDFSDPSLPAVHMAADEAKRRGVRFRVVHCLDFDETAYLGGASMPGMMIGAPLPQSMIDDLERETRSRLTGALAAMNIVSEGVLVKGRPAEGIEEAARAEPTALIVVGTRGRTGLARLALGSVAEAVMSHAPCSVLVVPLHPA